jgi:hypothetical protein
VYLLNITANLGAIFCFRGIVVPRDGVATTANVLAHETLVRVGSSLQLISTAASVIVAALLYELLKRVNSSVALVAAFFRLVACAVAVCGYVLQLAPLESATGNRYFRGLGPEQLDAIGILLYRLHGPAASAVIVFFGFHFIFLGYLIYRAKSLPRLIALLTTVAGVGALVFLAPPVAVRFLPYFAAIGLLAEVSLAGYLLVRGMNLEGKKAHAEV